MKHYDALASRSSQNSKLKVERGLSWTRRVRRVAGARNRIYWDLQKPVASGDPGVPAAQTAGERPQNRLAVRPPNRVRRRCLCPTSPNQTSSVSRSSTLTTPALTRSTFAPAQVGDELSQTVQASLREHLVAASAATSALHLQIASADALAEQMQDALGLRVSTNEAVSGLIDTDAVTETLRTVAVDPSMLKDVEIKVSAGMWKEVARTSDYFKGFGAAQRTLDDLLPNKDLLAQFAALQPTVRNEELPVRAGDPVSVDAEGATEAALAATRDAAMDHVGPKISFRDIVDTLVLAGIFEDVAEHPEHARMLILFAVIIFVVRYGN